MSVINETLDNLKKTKKRSSVNPSSSSFYYEKNLKSEKIAVSKQSYFIPLSFAVLVGLLFYISHLFFSNNTPQTPRKEHHYRTISWFKANLRKHTDTTQNLSHKPVMLENKAAQKMYYDALVLLNEGKEDQALQGLQKIIAQYPDFVPAQRVHAMLKTG
ncbi:MAG: hypothetical protein ACO1N3_00465 [Gammaproteobacteria bacterium]